MNTVQSSAMPVSRYNHPYGYTNDYAVVNNVNISISAYNTNNSIAATYDNSSVPLSFLTDKSVVCQDFLRGVCFRSSCKFKHIKDHNSEVHYVFCHDYQKGRCTRIDCRFIHCSVSDEEHYRMTGKLLPHVQAAFLRAKLGVPNKRDLAIGGIPICRDYVKGTCDRVTCKYRHEDKEEQEFEPDAKRLCQRHDEIKSPDELIAENVILRKRNAELEAKIKDIENRLQNAEYANEELLLKNKQLKSQLDVTVARG